MSSQSPTPQVDTHPETSHPVFCPVVAALVHEKHLPMTEQGLAKISDLKPIMVTLGFSSTAAYVAGIANRLSNIVGNIFIGRFNALTMREGLINHTCDTGILDGGNFDQGKFDRLVSYGRDGKLTKADFLRAIEDRKAEQGGTFLGAALSQLEFSILLSSFGTGTGDDRHITTENLLGLYRDKELPGNHFEKSRIVMGSLIHEESSLDQSLSGLRVELFHRRNFPLRSWLPGFLVCWLDRKLAAVDLPSHSNKFKFQLDPYPVSLNIQIRVIDTRKTVSWWYRRITVIDGNSGIKGDLNLGALRVPHWEYDKTYAFPTALINTYTNKLPQSFTWHQWIAFDFTIARLLLSSLILNLKTGWRPDLRQIQATFGDDNEKIKQYQRADDDEYFVYRILNGFNPAMLYEVQQNDPEEHCNEGSTWTVGDANTSEESHENRYFVEYDFTAYESDKNHNLVSTKLFLHLQDEKMLPTRIVIKVRKEGETDPNSDYGKCYNVTPGDPEWKAAKRAFRSAWAVAGELDSHLCTGHLNVGQYAIAAYRNLHRNPLKNLLLPFLRGVTKINDKGKTAIFGIDGVLSNTTPFTTSAAWIRLATHLGTLDWFDWSPRKPLADYKLHVYPKAANIYWNVCEDCVESFFAENESEIKEHWVEIKRFSDDLYENSVPFQKPHNDDRWYDTSEKRRDKPEDEINEESPSGDQLYTLMLNSGIKPSQENNKEKWLALHRIAQSDRPTDNDTDNLKQVCRYIIFHATFWHWWSNDLQRTDVGNIYYAPLGLRNGAMDDSDVVLPPPHEAKGQLEFATLLSTTRAGTIMSNKMDDIYSCFIETLDNQRFEFSKLKNNYEPDITFDIDRIRSRTNI